MAEAQNAAPVVRTIGCAKRNTLRNLVMPKAGAWPATVGMGSAELPSGKIWYIALTEANRERVAIRTLGMRGFVAYSPIWAKTLRRRGVETSVTRTLFSRIIFVGQDPHRGRFIEIERCAGVSSLVRVAGAPAKLSEAAMFNLRAMELAGCFTANQAGLVEVVTPKAPVAPSRRGDFEAGKAVRVVDGKFAGFIATVFQAPEADRLKLLLEIFGRSCLVDVEMNSVEVLLT